VSAVLDWASWGGQPWHLPRPRVEEKDSWSGLQGVFFTRHGIAESSIRRALVDLIGRARERVFCCSFLIGGSAVREALVDAARRLRGHVYVVTALDEKLLGRTFAMEEDSRDLRTILDRQRKDFRSLTHSGVYLRGAEGVHAKLCVVDGKEALLGSANFDPNGLGEDRSFAAGEVGVLLEGTARVAPLASLFRHIWRYGCAYEVQPHPVHYALQGRSTRGSEVLKPPGAKPGAPLWTGFGSTAILDGLQSLINQVRERLVLASYSFTGMRARPELLFEPLLATAKRGVSVELYLRSRAKDLPELGPLVEAGVVVRGDPWNHAKYAVADGKAGLIFSANYDGEHGLTSGVETGVSLLPEEVEPLLRYHQLAWNAADTEVALLADRADLARRLPIDDAPWPHEMTLELAGEGRLGLLAEEMARRPCLIAAGHEGPERELVMIGTERSLRLLREDRRWRPEELPVGNSWTVARLLARGRRADLSLWLPEGLEVRAG
jgi:phosphatidylserine/phosphatidylglycerophosphate/cardiolipin synthase-like enzyme